MDKPCLNNKDEYPREDVLLRVLGGTKDTWDAFSRMIKDRYPAFSGEWRYYNDGKSWLFKLVNKKKTVCWVSVYPNMFKTSFYFADKAESFITAGKLDGRYVDQFVHGKKFGKIRAITVDVTRTADLDSVETLIGIKEQAK